MVNEKKSPKKQEEATFLREQAETILEKMGIPAVVDVTEPVADGPFCVEIEPKDKDTLPLLIGYHGQTLNAVQAILGLLAFRKFGEFSSVFVEAGGYRKEREEELRKRALEAADKARFLLKEVSFPAMPPLERRIIHVTLSQEKGVTTESRGEGGERHVVVIPTGVKSSKSAATNQ